ncbi:hypothetical protein EDB81DRAFT_879824 [Dactylonectria macrodidyma]|uniref:Uncharacterized protein n=1 Tax=Dactylonectria macrodidyma TaxID=307937 RepID=A0A9P9JJU9_9HYPO|nr:hypothetical protein EDB81DRAFT_879824 [Dactylonectria macrodidyma]
MKAFSVTSKKYRFMLSEYIFTNVRFEGTQTSMSSELGAFLSSDRNIRAIDTMRNKADTAKFIIKPDDQAQEDNQLVQRILDSIQATGKLRVLVLDLHELTPVTTENAHSQEAQFGQGFQNLPELKLEDLKLFGPKTLPPIIISKCDMSLLEGFHADRKFIEDILLSNRTEAIRVMIRSLQGLKKLFFAAGPDVRSHPVLSQVRQGLHIAMSTFPQIRWLGFIGEPTPEPFLYPGFYGCIDNMNALLKQLPNLERLAFPVLSTNIVNIPETPDEPPTGKQKAEFYKNLIDHLVKDVPTLLQVDILDEAPIVWRGTRSVDGNDMVVKRLELPDEKRRSAYPFGTQKGDE